MRKFGKNILKLDVRGAMLDRGDRLVVKHSQNRFH